MGTGRLGGGRTWRWEKGSASKAHWEVGLKELHDLLRGVSRGGRVLSIQGLTTLMGHLRVVASPNTEKLIEDLNCSA